ncbi:MAG: carbohydrate ABC transporter permease [Christensenellales bacterium]
MKRKKSAICFDLLNSVFMIVLMFSSLMPLLHMLAVSLSEARYGASGLVGIIPKGFTLEGYAYLLERPEFFKATWITVKRVVIGTILETIVCVLTAYPLSKSNKTLHGRTVYAWFFAFTMFFGGGLIPYYFVIRHLGLLNDFWVLILPGMCNVGRVVMMMNFFRRIPKALEEAAFIDGAGHSRVLFSVILPLSLPSIATIVLFTATGHWNSWFDGQMFMNKPANYPLATYLRQAISVTNTSKQYMTQEELERLSSVDDITLRMAQVFLGTLPIMCIYPFLQKYFVKGIVVGAVKE